MEAQLRPHFSIICIRVSSSTVESNLLIASFTHNAILSFGDDFDMAIVKYAAFLAWSSLDGKQNTAAAQLQEYQLEIDTLVSTYIFDDINDLTFGLQKRTKFFSRENVLDRHNRF